MSDKYILHSRGKNWFHFRTDKSTAIESFSVTYCHDGTVCMTGDMGCLVWQRQYFPKTLDYGFPFNETGIEYFAEKIVRAEESQVTKSWNQDLALSDIKNALSEDRDENDRGILLEICDCLSGFESGEYGYFQMLEAFNGMSHSIECEEYCEYGRWYSPHLRMRFELLKSVSHLIVDSVARSKLDPK